MKWESYIRKVGGTYYVSLPQGYIKAHMIDRDELMGFNLNEDGSLTLRKGEDQDE